MQTQRVNVYVSGSGVNVFYIEQLHPVLAQWFTIGETYDLYEHAEVSVNLHNIRQIAAKLKTLNQVKETK